jgi:hypothetical protein
MTAVSRLLLLDQTGTLPTTTVASPFRAQTGSSAIWRRDACRRV